MNAPSRDLSDAELAELDDLLQQVPEPLRPLDLSALDGFLVGVLLQPRRPEPRQWWPLICDEEGREWPVKTREGPAQTGAHQTRLQALVLQRLRQLDAAIQARRWFDPWLLKSTPDLDPHELVQPWVLGFATACTHFPELTDQDGPDFNEALAGIYQHLDLDDLEDAEALVAEIESLEPPATLEEAVESLVRSSLLLADISRPLRRPTPRRKN